MKWAERQNDTHSKIGYNEIYTISFFKKKQSVTVKKKKSQGPTLDHKISFYYWDN